ncbi:putative nuclease HARBI1 [Haematobia irritans]|uniref:putative nuclease HARBI1 n=1 Tax=Haematobia irritans TaxID=7368 RepID=UPI003F500BC6
MDLELLEHFQNDLNDMEVFRDFLTVDNLIRNVNCSKRFVNLGVLKGKKSLKNHKRRRFNPLQDLTEEEFQHSYRFTKDSMKRLLDMIKDDLDVEQYQSGGTTKKDSQVPVEKQIMAAVRYWGRTEHPETTAQIHGITVATLSKISKRVAEALSYKASRYIRMPCLLAEKEKVTKAFYDLAHMPQVIGAVNHLNIRCKRPWTTTANEQKPDDIFYVQIVTDSTLKIRDLDCHTVKSAGNIKSPADIFAQSRIKERFEQNEFRGRLLLGDSVLKCSSYLYTPLTQATTLAEQAFNSSLRITYEPARRCLKLWQERFGILNCEFSGSPAMVRHIIIALVLLHNMAIEWEDKALDKKSTADDFETSNSYESFRSSDERSRAEFIKNHFTNYLK